MLKKEEIIEGIDCSWYEDCIYYKQCEQLKQENEELKAKVKMLDRMTGIFSARLVKKYKHALEEIREMAKFNQFYNPEKLIINGDIGQIQNLKMTEIYNKINEVLNEK